MCADRDRLDSTSPTVLRWGSSSMDTIEIEPEPDTTPLDQRPCINCHHVVDEHDLSSCTIGWTIAPGGVVVEQGCGCYGLALAPEAQQAAA